MRERGQVGCGCLLAVSFVLMGNTVCFSRPCVCGAPLTVTGQAVTPGPLPATQVGAAWKGQRERGT